MKTIYSNYNSLSTVLEREDFYEETELSFLLLFCYWVVLLLSFQIVILVLTQTMIEQCAGFLHPQLMVLANHKGV